METKEINMELLIQNGKITLGSLGSAAGFSPWFNPLEQEIFEGRLRSPDEWDWLRFYDDDGKLIASRQRVSKISMRILPADLLSWIEEYPDKATKFLGDDCVQQVITRLK